MDRGVLEKIKNVIYDVAGRYNIEIDRIILFGSRARGDHREDSDWDILIVTKRKLDRDTFWDFYSSVKRSLARVKIYGDLLVVSRSYYEEKRRNVGNISYYATVEGKVL
ncbi:MAG: hypothetical protein B6U94_08855 [Thermofilum sp. ex4484_79]|nr:MAG: hypothetical protein B6U94_08855 [Thermofilum sp. ex4484_79]